MMGKQRHGDVLRSEYGTKLPFERVKQFSYLEQP